MFELDKDQSKKISKWIKHFDKVYEGAIGGRFTYMFTPTSLGIVIKVQDGVTRDILDVTDYDTW